MILNILSGIYNRMMQYLLLSKCCAKMNLERIEKEILAFSWRS